MRIRAHTLVFLEIPTGRLWFQEDGRTEKNYVDWTWRFSRILKVIQITVELGPMCSLCMIYMRYKCFMYACLKFFKHHASAISIVISNLKPTMCMSLHVFNFFRLLLTYTQNQNSQGNSKLHNRQILVWNELFILSWSNKK